MNFFTQFTEKGKENKGCIECFESVKEVLNNLGSYIYMINVKTYEILYMNEDAEKIIKADYSNGFCYNLFRGEPKPCAGCPVQKLLKENKDKITFDIYNEKFKIWIETTATFMDDINIGKVCLISCKDVTKQKMETLQHIQQLEKLAYVDELTGERNYYKFTDDAQQILEHSKSPFHLVIKLDIDNFRLINQIYGYKKGDEILRHVAKALEMNVRNENEIFARIASDDFIALYHMKDISEVDAICKKFLNHFNQLVGNSFPFKCIFSYGKYVVSAQNSIKMDIMDMYEKVNIAHKSAKSNKSVKSVEYNDSMIIEALSQKEVENQMEEALAKEEFIVYLQPKYFLDDETIGGAEALVRWKSNNEEFFYPNSFIPIFERNGFVTKLDFYMLGKVCEIIKKWIEAGVIPTVVSVNFSRLHLSNKSFVKEIIDTVDRYGVDRKYIEIEITESVIYDNIDTFEGILNKLHKAGFTMSMDDFGSGYSSLGILKNLEVDVIKMDRSFFVNQKDAKRSETIVKSVIEMATSLGIRIVAEGVEDKEHIELLKKLNCDMAQGYYFARPMPVEDFTKLL